MNYEVLSRQKTIVQGFAFKYEINLYFTVFNLAVECDECSYKDRNNDKEKSIWKKVWKWIKNSFIRFKSNVGKIDKFAVISESNVFIIKRKKESMKFHMMKKYLAFRKRKWRLKKSNEKFF